MDDEKLARSLENEERSLMKKKEREEFERLQALHGFEKGKNIARQGDANLFRSVQKGKMSAVDYHEKRIMLKMSEKNGVDDGSSATQGDLLIKDWFIIKVFCQSVIIFSADITTYLPKLAAGSGVMWKCSAVDHYMSSFGDTGWGCGYRYIIFTFVYSFFKFFTIQIICIRNLQMLLSALLLLDIRQDVIYLKSIRDGSLHLSA